MPPQSFSDFSFSDFSPCTRTNGDTFICQHAVTFSWCCGNMMRTSCLREPLSHSQFGVFFVCVYETVSFEHNRGPTRFIHYLLSSGSFVIKGTNHHYCFITTVPQPSGAWVWTLVQIYQKFALEHLKFEWLKSQIMIGQVLSLSTNYNK